MTLRTATKLLLGLALGLPLLHSLLAWVAALLNAMGDEPAAAVTGHVGTVIGVFWLASLAALVIVLALKSLNDQPRDE